jgi:hypothetical protein
MTKTNRAQREALKRVYQRMQKPAYGVLPFSYRQFRRTVEPGPGCIMVPYCGMWLGIEPDGYTHS